MSLCVRVYFYECVMCIFRSICMCAAFAYTYICMCIYISLDVHKYVCTYVCICLSIYMFYSYFGISERQILENSSSA